VIGAPAHELTWVAAAPLWQAALGTPATLRRPTILGWGRDDFMEDLLATLASAPGKIADRVASGPSRSFRERLPGEAYDATPAVDAGMLKLYQPVHGWFYLVAGSLVCQLPGLPDHAVDLAAGEKAGFVIRRLGEAGAELALRVDAAGKRSWAPVTAPDALEDGEDVLPVFPLGYQDAGRQRRLFAGLLPAGNQELLFSAPLVSDPADAGLKPPPADALAAVQARVTGAIRALQSPPSPPPTPDQQREISRFALLDLADFLRFYLPGVLDALQHGTPLTGKAAALAAILRSRTADPTVDGATLAALLATILDAPLTSAFRYNLANADRSLPGDLDAALHDALDEANPGALAAPADAPRISQSRYVARLVYRRPQCAPLRRDVVSPPSEPFLIAPYFDPEAPSRPIRISLPFDPSIQGLRKFRKNVRFVLSEALRQKTSTPRINDKIDGPNLECGAVELSIPIITIVAMIILFVFIALLNIVFWWIPFVKICLPRIKVEA
jgi:hypothetical protein